MKSRLVVSRWSMFWQLLTVHPKGAMKELYEFALFFSFASSLIAIFEPIFFYQQAFSLSRIAMYYALHYTLYLFLMPLGAKFVARFGSERSVAASLPLFVLYFLVLAGIPDAPWLFWVALVLLALHKMFYWPAYHVLLARGGDRANRGTELSWLGMVSFSTGVLGPLFGGIVAAVFGFQVLFVLVAITVLISAVPMLHTKERYERISFSYVRPWQMMVRRANRGMVLAMAGMGENFVDLVFWPIFLFIILGTTAKVGAVSAIATGVMALLGFVIGEMSDRISAKAVLRLNVPFMVIGYFFRPLALANISALLTNTLSRMAYVGVSLPMTYRLYERARHEGYLPYVTAAEMMLALAKAVTAWLLCWLFFVFLPFPAFVIT